MPAVPAKKRPARAPAPKPRAGVAARTPRAQMLAAHAAVATPPAAAREPLNVRAALDLGDTLYVTFRGKPFGIPPVGWKLGLRLRALWLEARQYPAPLTPVTGPKYAAVIAQLPALLWPHMRPASRASRLIRRLGLARNPLDAATEQELVDLAGFFLLCLTRSSIGVPPPTATTPAATS